MVVARLSRRSFLGGTLLGLGGTALGAEPPASPDLPPPVPPGPEVAPATVRFVDRVPVAFTVDGEAVSVEVDEDRVAADTLRACGRTGVKVACGGGTCGACTVLVDGAPQVTCLLPTTALHGRAVTTAQGLGGPEVGSMHCVQKAFLAHDALQCGYCTPGFVVEAAAFVDAWRAAQGDVEPPRETVAAALAGHLCRCGAYAAIHGAVAAACRGEHDGPDGVSTRVEGPEKVGGRAVYTVDVTLPGLLEGVVLRSPHAHARLGALDLAPARAMGATVIRLLEDGALVRFVGQEVAAVAAADRRTARAAATAITARWLVLPASVTVERARQTGAPAVYPEPRDAKGAPTSAEGLVLPAGWDGNLRGPSRMAILAKPATARRAIADATFRGGTVHYGVYTTAAQCHTAFEPHAAVARWTDGALELWASTQSIGALAEDLADAFDLRPQDVRVHAEHVGGGFGAKMGLAVEHRIAVLLAREAKAPVRVANDRAEELLLGGFRPGGVIELSAAITAQDALALHHTSWADAGCAVGNATGYVTRVFYDTPLLDIDDWDIVTHTAPGKPMRAPGGPMTLFAVESAMDDLAHQRGEDPVALRRRFDRNVPRGHLYSWAETLPRWRDRGPVAAGTGRHRRGVGLAAGVWFQLFDPGTQVELEASDRELVVRTATQDIGSGSRSLVAHTIARALGVPVDRVRVVIGDSRLVHGPAAGGSRSASSLVPACLDAVERLTTELAVLAEERGLPAGTPREEVLRGAAPIRVTGRRRPDALAPIVPFSILDFRAGRVFTGTVVVAEVEVDTQLGLVRCTGAHVGVGAGRVADERLARSQVEGAFVQSLGFALYEERRHDPVTGRLVSHTLDDYHLPGLGDVPPIEVHFETRGFEHVRGGVAGLGEVGGVAVPAAIANAVFHATGRRPFRLPLSPEHVLGDAP